MSIVRIALKAPVFQIGQRVYCNGQLYKGFGTVTEVRAPGEGKFLGDAFPQVVVKPDDYRGGDYGSRTLLRYNGDDLEAGELLTEAQAPKPEKKYAFNPCGDNDDDPVAQAVAAYKDAQDAFQKASAALIEVLQNEVL